MLGTQAYTYDAANRLTAVNGVAYTWDDANHLLEDGERTYAWDPLGRLTQVVSGTTTTQHTYNGDGARTRQVVSGPTTDYVQDLAAPLPMVLVEQESGQRAYYLYGLDLVGREQTAWQYYHYDGLGSVRQLTDAGGQEVAGYDYYAFGGLRAASGTAQGGNEWRFTGEQWDAGAGLYFLRARYYEPGVGRFVSADPIRGYAQHPRTQNAYPYAWNNPVNKVDPSGKYPCADDECCPPPKCPALSPNEILRIARMLYAESENWSSWYFGLMAEKNPDGTEDTRLDPGEWGQAKRDVLKAAWTLRNRYDLLQRKRCKECNRCMTPRWARIASGKHCPIDLDPILKGYSDTYDAFGSVEDKIETLDGQWRNWARGLFEHAKYVADRVFGDPCERNDPTNGMLSFKDTDVGDPSIGAGPPRKYYPDWR